MESVLFVLAIFALVSVMTVCMLPEAYRSARDMLHSRKEEPCRQIGFGAILAQLKEEGNADSKPAA